MLQGSAWPKRWLSGAPLRTDRAFRSSMEGEGHGSPSYTGVWAWAGWGVGDPSGHRPFGSPFGRREEAEAGNSAQFFPQGWGQAFARLILPGQHQQILLRWQRRACRRQSKKGEKSARAGLTNSRGRPMFPRKQVLPPAPFSGKRHKRCISLGRGSA